MTDQRKQTYLRTAETQTKAFWAGDIAVPNFFVKDFF